MSKQQPAKSILILGSGVFGLSTAWALTRRPAYKDTSITLVSPDLADSPHFSSHSQASKPTTPCSPASSASSLKPTGLPTGPPISPSSDETRTTPASIDTTRIIRADYADPHYASLANEAQELWRTPEWGGGSAVIGSVSGSSAVNGRDSGSRSSTTHGSCTVTDDGKHYHENGLLLTANTGGTGEAYMRKSFSNIQKQQRQRSGSGAARTSASASDATPAALLNESEISKAMRTTDPSAARGTGNIGYVNGESGWADAEACMRELEARVRGCGRVEMLRGEVVKLVTSPPSGNGEPTKVHGGSQARSSQIRSRVTGALLRDGTSITAELTILATGAWTPSLLDLRGRASVTAQSMAYFDVSEPAAALLKDIPVHLNIGTGCFLFPPNRKRARSNTARKTEANSASKSEDANSEGYEIKVARHAFGYSNPTTIPAPLGSSEAANPPSQSVSQSASQSASTRTSGTITVSLPVPSSTPIPTSDIALLTTFLRHALPVLGDVGIPSRTRLCHYLDTISGEYIIDYHPDFEGLFVATGGSGHAFKMLPVLGGKVVDVMEVGGSRGVRETEGTVGIEGTQGTEGTTLEGENSGGRSTTREPSKATKAWAKKWAWPARQEEDQVWCDDGSRAGVKGLSLADVRRREGGSKL